MARTSRLLAFVAKEFPEHGDALDLIKSGSIAVNGIVVQNPDSMVNRESTVSLVHPRQLRGVRKLGEALKAFRINPLGWTALDIGAAAGGFTQCLLDAGAARVYAVDVGHGQLSSRLRLDSRVIVMENTNIAALSPSIVKEKVQLFTMDLSYLSLGAGVSQLTAGLQPHDANLLGLVKPMFELGLPAAPTDIGAVDLAIGRAATAIENAGWKVVNSDYSTVGGAKGAAEGWIHALMSA